MKKILSALLVFSLIVSMFVFNGAALDSGKIYYVDATNGSDLNSGLSEYSAWKTIERASENNYSAGDKVLLKCGEIFCGTFAAKGSGSEQNPVTLGCYGDISNGKPVLTSGDEGISLISLCNVSGWTIDSISMTSQNGRGILIKAALDTEIQYLTVKDCDFSDFHYVGGGINGSAYVPLLICSDNSDARIRHLTISGCSFTHSGYAIIMSGLSQEWTPDKYVSPEESYNTDFLLEDLSMYDILYDGIIIMSVHNMIIRNSSFIKVSLDTTSYTAPVWSHHADSFVVENCEIAGAENYNDGMAVDFDGWTTNATYQYIYSHDNPCFINNCCYDSLTRNKNCTVRYCLSVNDNMRGSTMSQLLTSGSHEYEEGEEPDYMDGFKFYNNTLINMSTMDIKGLKNAVIANNIFVGEGLSYFTYTRKNTDDITGEPVITEFDGIFTNNCFCGVAVPYLAENNFVCEPGFSGNDTENISSYTLSTSSLLLGKGISVEEDMGDRDFYGNALTSTHNIGCYEGSGEEKQSSAGFFEGVKHTFWFIISTIYNIVDTISGRFWLC